MKTTHRLVALLLALGLGLVACTSEGESEGGDSGPTGSTGNDSAPTETISVPPGSTVYRYANAGLVATIDFDAETLEIENGTGRELPEPGFYVLDARDGERFDGEVSDAAPVSAGETSTFAVSLDGIELRNVGLVILLMGVDNYGAFVQQ
jgi:hypothetical protein